MSDTANTKQTDNKQAEKLSKTRHTEEHDSILTPTFAASSQSQTVSTFGIPLGGDASASGDDGGGMSGLAGANFSRTLIQPNLMVNAPGDAYEQEADRVADEVMRMPDPSSAFAPVSAPPLPLPLNNAFAIPVVSRMPLTVTPLPRISRIQTSDGAGGFEAPPSVEGQVQQMQSGGQPLPESERTFFEQRMGYDFSGVRVHTDSSAVQASNAIQAQAFTTGRHIAFNDGKYQPGTGEGRSLLAHELTHVVQQGEASALSMGALQAKAMATAGTSAVLRQIQRFHEDSAVDNGLYRRELSANEEELEIAGKGVDINRREQARKLRRCAPSPSPAPAATALAFSSKSFSAGSGGTITATPSASGTNVVIASTAFNPSGEVEVKGGTDAEAQDWEAGFIQTVFQLERKAHYIGSKKETMRTAAVPSPPVRDALVKSGEPWYDPNNTNGTGRIAFSKTDSSEKVSLWDKPQTTPPWDTPDGKGKLDTHDGKDVFTAWMIARKKSAPNTIQFLNWNSWEVTYDVTFNYASSGAKTVKSVSGKTSSKGSGAGQGSTSPTLSGSIANDVIKVTWS